MAGPRRSRSRGLGWIALGIALAPVVIPGCSPKVGAARTPPPPVVTVVEARRMTVPVMAEPIGTTRALQEVSIRARVRGFLKEIHFQEGAEVKKGQLLFVIDEEPFKAKLADAQAALEQAEAALKKAQDSKAREVAQAQLAVGQVDARAGRGRGAPRAVALQAERLDGRGRPAQAGHAPEGRGAGRSLQGQPRPGQCRLRDGHRRRPGRRRRGEGTRHRRPDRPELLPDVLADRRADRPRPGQARETSSAPRPGAAPPTTPSSGWSGSSTPWASTSRSRPGTSTG